MWSINKGKIGLQKILYDCMTKDAQKSSHLRIGVAERTTAGRVCPYSAAGFMGS